MLLVAFNQGRNIEALQNLAMGIAMFLIILQEWVHIIDDNYNCATKT